METAKHSFSRIGKTGGLEATQSAGKHWLSQLEQPWLLIVNNADDPNLELSNLFPEGERGHILVTTRNPDFRIHGTVGSAEFDGLQEREALLLLLKAADIRSPWDASTEDSGNQITNTLGYLALALMQAGALILQGICDIKDYLIFYNQNRRDIGKRRRSVDAVDHDPYSVNSSFDLSLKYLEKRQTQGSRDALQLLSIVGFFHFEHIRVDIFTRALENRVKAFEGSKNKSLSSSFIGAIRNRLQQPLLLPEFLRQKPGTVDRYRVRRALHELRSFSLISYDGRTDCFSMHPLVHAWARDRLTPGEQAVWMHIARNTLGESILLPPNDKGHLHEEFRRDILSHLDHSLSACPIQIIDFTARFGGLKLPYAILMQYTAIVNFREQVLLAAKFGYVYLERGRFNNAALFLAMVKDALIQSRGFDNDLTMKAMLALAGAYWGLGRLGEAVMLQKRVVEARTKVFGLENHETLSAMDQLGKSYWLNGQYHEALDLQLRTTECMERNLGPNHADTLAAMDNLGVTLGSWYRYQESMEIHHKVLQFREKTLGPTDVDTLTTLNNYAMALFDLKRHDEANQLMLKVYNERKSKLGKEHPWTLWALCYLAKIQSAMGCLEEAEDMLLGGIEAAKRSLGDDHLGVLMGCAELARVYARQHRYEESETLVYNTLQQLEQSRGKEHPDTVHALHKMAQLYELQGRLEKALETCAIAIERVDMRLTRKHPLGEEVYSFYAALKDRLRLSTQNPGATETVLNPVEALDMPILKISRSRTT
jgi:tetratricopeptide (TPR) repeat protein